MSLKFREFKSPQLKALEVKSYRLESSLNRQRGVALITVLMVFAIASMVAAKVIFEQTIVTKRMTGIVERTQAYYYALATEELGILALKADDEQDSEDNDTSDDLTEFWAQPRVETIDGIGQVQIVIYDLNRFFNVNNIIDDKGKVRQQEFERYKVLLETLDLDDELAENLFDWMDQDDSEDGYQSESDSYRDARPAYRAANRRVKHVSELYAVSGYSQEVMTKLLPHITAIDADLVLPINYNTGTEQTLATLLNTQGTNTVPIGRSGASNIISDRLDPYGQGETPQTRGLFQNISGGTVSSFIYEIHVKATYGSHSAYLSSVVIRDGRAYSVLYRTEANNDHYFLAAVNQQGVAGTN